MNYNYVITLTWDLHVTVPLGFITAIRKILRNKISEHNRSFFSDSE